MRQYWVAPLPPFHTADGTAYTGTAAIGDISPAPALVIPAHALEVGSRLAFCAFGRFTATATPGTIVIGIYIAPTASAIASGQAVAATSAIVPLASATNQAWRLEGNGSIRTVGTTGTIIGLLEISSVVSLTTSNLAPPTAPATLTFDTTVANKVMVGVTPSVTTGSWQLHYFGVRLVN
jgi:hypothetical protein